MPRVSREEEIKLRRMAVLEHAAMGFSQSEIAQKLNYHKSTISNDIRYLKEKSKEEFRRYVDEELRFEHKVAIQGLKYVKKQAIAIAENTKDDRIRLHALTLFREVNGDLWDLHSASEVLGKWLEFVQARKVELRKLKQRHGYHEHHHIEGREGYDYKGINSHDENAKF